MEAVFGNFPALRAYGAVLGQEEASAMPPINDFRPPIQNGQGQSIQQVWQGLRMTCIGLLGEDTCTRLLGYQPFVCPTEPEEKPKGFTFKTVLIAAGVGVLVGKIIL